MNVIAEPVGIKFENSWRSNEVTDEWKRANVVFIFKKGRRKRILGITDQDHLTLIPGNTMEHIIKESISKYLEKNKVIGNSQHGFVRSKSCFTNLIFFYDKWQALWRDRKVTMIYLARFLMLSPMIFSLAS